MFGVSVVRSGDNGQDIRPRGGFPVLFEEAEHEPFDVREGELESVGTAGKATDAEAVVSSGSGGVFDHQLNELVRDLFLVVAGRVFVARETGGARRGCTAD